LWAALAALLAGLAGCQKLNYEKTITVAPAEVQAILVDAPSGEQKLTVDINPNGVAVDVYVVLEDKHEAVKQKLLGGGKPDPADIRGGQEKLEGGKVEATIPAGKGFAVLIGNARKKTEVKVKVTGS
jgi:hypothetical protein